VFVLAALFAAGCVAAVVGDRGFLDVRRARKELAEWERQVAERERIVEELRRQVERLRTDPLLLERIAREELGFVRPDEVVVLFEGEFDREDAVVSWTESRTAGPSGPVEAEAPPGRP
jgi:cell division protein FtsB